MNDSMKNIISLFGMVLLLPSCTVEDDYGSFSGAMIVGIIFVIVMVFIQAVSDEKGK